MKKKNGLQLPHTSRPSCVRNVAAQRAKKTKHIIAYICLYVYMRASAARTPLHASQTQPETLPPSRCLPVPVCSRTFRPRPALRRTAGIFCNLF